jgi:hypothetical protein
MNFGLTHIGWTFPLNFFNASQDWLILQIPLASLRLAHMASHWRMIVDAVKFNNKIMIDHDKYLKHTITDLEAPNEPYSTKFPIIGNYSCDY